MKQTATSAGGIAGLLTFGAMIASMFGKSTIASTLGDPNLASALTIGIGAIGALVSGFLPNKKPTTPAA